MRIQDVALLGTVLVFAAGTLWLVSDVAREGAGEPSAPAVGASRSVQGRDAASSALPARGAVRSAESQPRASKARTWTLEMGAPGAGSGRSSSGALGPGRDGARTASPSPLTGSELRPAPDPSGSAEVASDSISGRVLDGKGRPVPALTVVSVPVATQAGDGGLALASPRERSVRSGPDGTYRIGGLAPGDYLISSLATDRYASASRTVRAGFASADLVVVQHHRVRVFGTVTDTRGEPLAGVRVVPAHQKRVTRTDDDGNYETYVIARSRGTYAFRFLAEDHEEERFFLQGDQLVGLAEKRLDAQLAAAAETTTVSGTLRTERGERVPGETVRLDSELRKARYSVVSDENGDFSIAEVKVGSDYRVTIRPAGRYEHYVQDGLDVGREDAVLDLVLAPLDGGRLSGRMVDPLGNPLPGFSLWLQSTKNLGKLIPVSADRHGYFVLEDAPEGHLSFKTRTSPHLQVQGITLSAGDEEEVELVVDWGHYDMRGRVVDDSGRPVAGAQVTLRWSHQGGGTRSSSTRRGMTDASGTFRFTQVGPGRHELDVAAPGYGTAREVHEIGGYSREAEVRLEPLPS